RPVPHTLFLSNLLQDLLDAFLETLLGEQILRLLKRREDSAQLLKLAVAELRELELAAHQGVDLALKQARVRIFAANQLLELAPRALELLDERLSLFVVAREDGEDLSGPLAVQPQGARDLPGAQEPETALDLGAAIAGGWVPFGGLELQLRLRR